MIDIQESVSESELLLLPVGKALGLAVGARVDVLGSSEPVGAARVTVGVLVATVLGLSRTNMPL